ncbi:hypothetical protein CC1G_14142 [Coprinopsis cinerea okayama7|uniref:Uncharacterized protein n=1 Tax=Coprinopsis cinerea (strain Okayama-7 / 130 / ATCC MYA-4618 / FGSC 9003) TaxID=240176 RepID=D6RLK3_COPC7|nr:hypothetical protein CC1G_14142 [Coprinopsis cinerea okayama7\|eukprot:XP_002911609.1 hypothetical protein CC1G_14142 [Coprinopsis cinerea okayama7\
MSSSCRGRALTIIVFGVLGILAPLLIFGNMKQSRLAHLLYPMCLKSDSPPEATPFRLRYTGILHIDQLLCTLVSFFQPALDPSPLPVLKYFLGTHGPLVLIPLVESKRRGSRFPVRAAMVMWGLYQLITIGVGSPWYWLGFILHSNHNTSKSFDMQALPRSKAKAVVASFITGSVLPFAAMMFSHDPWATAAWQVFPLLTWISDVVFSRVFSTPEGAVVRRSGTGIIGRVYGIVFVVSAVTHVKYAQSLRLWELSSQVSPTTSIRDGVDMFLKWDLLFGYGTFMLGSCWFATTRKELALVIVWNIMGTIVVGPGAVLAATSIWRECRVDGLNVDQAKEK